MADPFGARGDSPNSGERKPPQGGSTAISAEDWKEAMRRPLGLGSPVFYDPGALALQQSLVSAALDILTAEDAPATLHQAAHDYLAGMFAHHTPKG